MKFGVILDKHKVEVHEHDIPEIKENQVLIQNKACNICTTDYQQWLGLRSHQKAPMAFGHENAGIVCKVGPEVRSVQIGDHVVSNVYKPCLECANCRKNMNSMYCMNLCNKFNIADEFGYYGLYGCGEYLVEDSKYIFKINSEIPFEQAGFCEPLATVIHGMNRLRIERGKKVLVIGVGTMGAINAQVARYYGADVIISDISEKKLSVLKEMGFNKLVNAREDDYIDKIKEYADGDGLSSIIIAVGTESAYSQAVKVVSKGSKLLIFSSSYPEPSWDLTLNLIHYDLLEIIGTYGCSTMDYQCAVEMINSNNINVEKLVEDRYSLDEVKKAFEAATKQDSYRVSVLL